MYEKSIELLNKAVADELSAVHQYMYFHFHCDDQGYDLLASLFKKTAIDEMIHVEHLAERILFLKGDVEMGVTDKVQKIHDVKAMLELAAKMEQESAREYNLWANECSANADSVSKKSSNWSQMRSAITTSLILNLIIWLNLVKNILLCSP